MREKLMGVIPLIIALLLVVGIGAYSGPSYAADTASQVVNVTVKEVISINTTGTLNLGEVNPGEQSADATFDIFNIGNVKIDLLVRAASSDFTGATETIPILNNYYIKSNITGDFVNFQTTNLKIYDDMPKGTGGSSPAPASWTTAQHLKVPLYTAPGNYTITVIYSAVKHNTP